MLIINCYFRQRNKSEIELVDREKEIIEIPDAEAFAEQLIEEVKMSHHIKDMEIKEEGECERSDKEYRRRISPSGSYSRSSSPPRNRSRSPHNRTRTSRRRNLTKSPEPVRRNEKKYTEYSSDSDFSSDSDK